MIITTGGPARPRVLDASPEAVGVAADQGVAEALSCCAGAVTLPVDTGYLSEVNDGFLAGLWDVVPAVEAAGWGVFYLNLTGMAGMYGGTDGLADALLSPGEEWLRPRLGIGMGKFPAYCAAAQAEARGWKHVPTDAARWLAALPASWLPLDGVALARLEGWQLLGIWWVIVDDGRVWSWSLLVLNVCHLVTRCGAWESRVTVSCRHGQT